MAKVFCEEVSNYWFQEPVFDSFDSEEYLRLGVGRDDCPLGFLGKALVSSPFLEVFD